MREIAAGPTVPGSSGKYPLPTGWKWSSLGELAEIVSGQSPPSDSYRSTRDGLPFFQGKADFGELHPVARAWCVAPERVAEPGDILLSVRAPVGPTNVADVRCCIGRGLAAVRPRVGVDRDFLLLALRHFESGLAKLGSGSTFTAITRGQLQDIQVPTPSLDDQRRVSAQVFKQMSMVERARASAEAQLSAADKLLSSHLSSVFRTEVISSWTRKRVSDIANTTSGATPSRTRTEFYGGAIPWVKTSELVDRDIADTEEHITDHALEETSATLLPPGTLLIAMYGQGQTRGRTGLLARSATTNQACFAILPNQAEFEPRFLQWWFRHSYRRLRLESEGRGGNQPNLNGDLLRAQEVPSPPVAEQKRITAELDITLAAVNALRRQISAQVEALRDLPRSLLANAFAGEA